MAEEKPNHWKPLGTGQGFKFEDELCEALRKQLPSTYRFLRSASLEADERAYQNKRRRPAEVDFVVAGPNGLFLLEAKWRDAARGAFRDRWVYKERDNDLSEAGESELMFKMKVNLIGAGRRVKRAGDGRFRPYENGIGIFVFPAHADIDLRDAAGERLTSFEAGMFHVTRIHELCDLIQSLPPPSYGGPGSARPPLLAKEQAYEMIDFFEGGVRPTPNVSVGFRILDARKNYQIAANGLPFAVCRLEDGMGVRRRGKWYDMTSLGDGDRAEFEEKVRRHGRVIAATTPHRNLLAYHKWEADVLGNGYWVIEDDVDADSLAARLETGAPVDGRKVLYGIANALKAVHAAQYIVRDLRPDSVLVERTTGEVKLTNFEVAKSTAGLPSVVASDWVFEPDPYRAPEVQLGRRDLDDPRTDVYSWAAIAFRLLTGQTFERAEQLEALAASDVPKAIAPVVRQGLAADRRERPALDAVITAINRWR